MNRPQAGDRINNYLLDERIGTGSFSEVWKAHHHVFNDLVAIKIPTDPAYVRYLQQDGIAIHGLRHPNIVRALDLDPYGEPAYLIMELIDGPSLRQVIDGNAEGLTLAAALPILSGVLAALEAAHAAGLIHGDIKPGNILIAGGPSLDAMTPERVKVADFGLGRQQTTGVSEIMRSGSIAAEDARRLVGTMAYMAPEQREGQPADERSDLYAVGIVLHEMLTGRLPHGADPPSTIRRDVPSWLDDIFQRCYTHRDRRFASAADMRAALDRHWRLPHTTPPPLSRPGQSKRKDGRSTCVHCGGSVEPADQFCIHCGRQLAEQVLRCPSCHAFVGQEDNFCILCGTDLRQRI